ncbi:sugar O-acyltransferase (sialic acid O-acetyltransferase NeuD family) [Marinobacter pelagius]|uniref:Sugar O-acyltransferase (Sialic acid O-acetyltransferase NeuD family) n=2 Tax=Marinobacter pelagius TaxID=379482 RepID=A0A366GDW1_9GAMM|nr:sugar O-acyltransferase (sialic acid O-acetyltransferase NeuD family) [Marinobacter pelagius]
MAREAGDIAWLLGLEPVYIARDEIELRAWSFSHQVILERDVEHYTDMPFVIGIGENTIRKAVAERFKGSLTFINLIHPSATFGFAQRELLEQGEGNIVAAGARFTSGTTVGNFCIFNQNATIAHDCIVESYVHVAPGANLSGNVHLKTGCWVGAGAVVNQGSNSQKRVVGENTVVGSGAIVIKDCEANAVYAGVPAKRIK